jgi:hypothetical protein
MPDPAKMSEKELALWMLNKIRDSERFLDVIRSARKMGTPDILDTPDYVARHKARLAKLYKDGEEDPVEAPQGVAAQVEGLKNRDLLSSREELIEKALAAYLAQHPRGAENLPKQWASTFELAQAEIEGRVTGAFQKGFVAELAQAGRDEMAKEAVKSRQRSGNVRDR